MYAVALAVARRQSRQMHMLMVGMSPAAPGINPVAAVVVINCAPAAGPSEAAKTVCRDTTSISEPAWAAHPTFLKFHILFVQ